MATPKKKKYPNPESNPKLQTRFKAVGKTVENPGGARPSRKQEFTADDLEYIVREIRNLAGEVDQIAAVIRRTAVGSIVTDGSEKWRRGCIMISEFVRNATWGLANAQSGIPKS